MEHQLTRVDDFVHFDIVLAGHVANNREDGEPGVDGRAERDDVDHDRVSADIGEQNMTKQFKI